MEKLKAKLKKQGGFTLIEMLIVVAIIAILIAVSIPMVNSSLEKAREATDAANERAFKAELLACYAMNDDGTGAPFKVNQRYFYNAADGKLVEEVGHAGAYGQSTTAGKDNIDRTGYCLGGKVDNNAVVDMNWTNGSKTADTISKTLLS